MTTLAGLLALSGLTATTLRAQTAPTEPSAAAAPDPSEAQKADAKAHFDKGLALFEEEAWDAALAEFVQSRALFATRAATKNAAICLRKLHRFDEAADMFEALLREFPNLPPAERALADAQSKELASYVGALVVQGAEPGSKVVVDGRDRGETPTPPLKVSAGTHVLRIVREGFAPFEQQFSIAGAQTTNVKVKLAPLLQGGRLHVEEATGQIVDVYVDGASVGKTPWDGMLPVGDHVVILRGDGNLGTQPALASIRLNGSTPIALRAEALQASLRISPKPAGATVVLDGVPVGRGAWSGQVRAGYHVLETRADGFVTDQRRIVTPADRETAVEVALRAVTAAPAPAHIFIEVDGAFGFAPSLGGDLTVACGEPCTKSSATGFEVLGHAGYEFGSGLGLLVDAGYLSLSQQLTGRDVSLVPRGLEANPGTASDDVGISGLRIGPAAQYHRGEKLTLTGRLGVGVFLGSARDQRKGSASTVERTDSSGKTIPAQSYDFALEESPAARYAYVAPELRLGYRLAEHFEISAGLRALVLVGITQPAWTDESPVFPGESYRVGQLTFGEQTLAGRAIFVVSPGLGARFDF
ncbi:MAG TPA: PEGA domain-containing protein [Polyangiaceae bacterium]|nr:PEGA domain-containing protein [Polyangiaceae bacterium]